MNSQKLINEIKINKVKCYIVFNSQWKSGP